MDNASSLLSLIDTTMREVVASKLADEQGFGVMIRYALGWENADGSSYNQPTGKRLRPLLVLLVSQALTENWRLTLPIASSVELLHNFSLIHDDIQDNSPIRHNRPTVWNVWGVPNAINAGDALFTLAYRALEDLRDTIPDRILLDIQQIFNITNIELTRGQHLDMRFENQPSVSVDEYVSMIKGKSAALLASSAQMAALVSTQNHSVAQAFAEFGLNIGVAFQIHDDILGIWGDPKRTGKSIATDITSRKKSFPVLYGLNHSQEMTQIYQKPSIDEGDIQRIVTLLDNLEARTYTHQAEQKYYSQAMNALERISITNDALIQFVDFLFQREH